MCVLTIDSLKDAVENTGPDDPVRLCPDDERHTEVTVLCGGFGPDSASLVHRHLTSSLDVNYRFSG